MPQLFACDFISGLSKLLSVLLTLFLNHHSSSNRQLEPHALGRRISSEKVCRKPGGNRRRQNNSNHNFIHDKITKGVNITEY